MLCLRWFANGDVGTSAHRFILTAERSAPLAADECYLERAAIQSALRSNLRITCASIGCIALVFSRRRHARRPARTWRGTTLPKSDVSFVVICRSAFRRARVTHRRHGEKRAMRVAGRGSSVARTTTAPRILATSKRCTRQRPPSALQRAARSKPIVNDHAGVFQTRSPSSQTRAGAMVARAST